MYQFVEIRKALGISQARLAAMTGISRSALNEVERGKRVPYPGWQQRIAEALGTCEEIAFQKLSGNGGLET